MAVNHVVTIVRAMGAARGIMRNFTVCTGT
jgi:hypothetical protein